MSWRDNFWGGYAPSKPIKVEGGIKAKSKRGSIGDTWWSKHSSSVKIRNAKKVALFMPMFNALDEKSLHMVFKVVQQNR